MGDPEIAAFVADRERLRVEGFGGFIDILAQKGAGLKEGLSRAEATDILLFMHGFAAIDFLLGQRGWTPEAWRDWSAKALAQLLLR